MGSTPIRCKNFNRSMSLKYYKPINASSRNTILLRHSVDYKSPLKNKSKGAIKTNGRNNRGKITVYHRGGGHKQLYRKILFQSVPEPLLVEALEYDPNRSASLARLFSTTKKTHHYTISPLELKCGQTFNGGNARLGGWLCLKDIPLGSKIHCIGTSFRPKKAVLQRSAGTYAQIVQKSLKCCFVKLSSGKIKKLKVNVKAVIGVVSNVNYRFRILGKAGRKRLLGFRPKTRGVAMNPIDHPHGGGEGKSSGGRPSVTPWAKPALGKKTSS